MRALTRSLALGGLVAAAFLAPPASASTRCVGEDRAYVCLVTPSIQRDSTTVCVYSGGTSCDEVEVPLVSARGPVVVYCGGVLACHQEIVDGCTILGVLTCQ